MTAPPPLRRLPAALLAVLASLVAVTATGQPAQAAEIYRYWAYFHVVDGEYVASTKGVGEFVPKDGSVEAYRYAAPADYANPNLPRADLGEVTFDALCGQQEAGAGEKRVGVIVDYGVEADAEGVAVPAPEAACAVVPADATALQVLDAVLDTRAESGLLCAISGYPASGCSAVVDAATPPDEGPVDFAVAGAEPVEEEPAEDSGAATTDPASADGEDGVSAALLIGVGLLVLLLLGGGVFLARRRG